MGGIRWRFVVLVLSGVFTALLPVLGFPRGFKNLLYIFCGLIIVFFAYYAYIGAMVRLKECSLIALGGNDTRDEPTE
ncbi:MAG: hypothetical protein Q8Q18_03145 [bacterium]|nr:hypothetical protein [bacterium]